MAFAFPLRTLRKQIATHARCDFPISRFQICLVVIEYFACGGGTA
jgi:hypothetical protein